MKVEELIGKQQILLGENILKQNLQEEISLSPLNTTLNRSQLTLMMDGGWDQWASGKAYNSALSRVVSVGAEPKNFAI